MQYSHLYAHIIEDDLAFAQALKGLLPGEFKITLSRKIEEARKNFLSQKHSLVFLDLCIEEAWDGFELLREIKEKNHLTTIIVITSSLDQKIHEKALELGASFVLSKNINHDLFDKILMNLLFKFKSKSEVIKENEHGSRFFFGNNKKLKTIESNLEKYSKTNLSILIEGETGTGKELLAKELSKNCKNFITIDCSTISNEISDSILFGHEKGSFTGAHERKIGLLEEANKGVIFFDEISNLSLDVQKKLLRVLQEKEVRSVGGNALKKVEFKIISASNVSIKKLIDEKKFLKDF
jgi:DNA-binding NtrC family response regulator